MKCFEHGGHVSDGGPCGGGLLGRCDADLSFAVVAEIGGLENRRAAEVGDGAREVVRVENGAERRQRKAGVREKRFFADAVLRGVQDFAGGAHGRVFGGGLGGGRGNIFEFESDHADAGGEAAHGVQIVVRGDDFEVGDLAGGRVGVGRKSVDAIAHAAGGDREHAAELAAAQHADGRAREDWLRFLPICRGILQDFCGLLFAEGAEFFAQLGARVGEDRDGEQSGVDRAGFADGERGHGNSGGHLHDREQRIHAFQRLAFDGNAEHRQNRVRGGHAGQMGRAARAGDDDFEAALGCSGSVFGQQLRRAMRGDDALLMRHAELGEHFARMAHGFPIGLAAHDDADERFFVHG